MAKRRIAARSRNERPSRSRAARLYRLVNILRQRTLGREPLLRQLRVGMRTFYRDLVLLRACGIEIRQHDHKYQLKTSFDACRQRLPFPDPELSFADIEVLAKGTSATSRKMKKLFHEMTC